MIITVNELADLDAAAKKVVEAIGNRKVIALYGQMGAGKTTLIKHICKVLDVQDVVNSPSFSLVNEYQRPNGDPIYHFDFYRINKIEEAFDFGYEEYFFSNNLCLIEWPEVIEDLIPDDAVKLTIQVLGDGRREIQIT
ncbi:tRNA (adenosine(37)-N6)-threonylcarbamoyltransferase complex ATPase subunit type 1 TsaE [uncultured Acetobacteroides sp.]|uniref:tRNA (adenosine(37)-N6)-threonylcarbamoyltransferase complex ATPase subunit type 1 TsaE n=1 Tax=uncultured Acetobacteroides sp. TaxID=1760811 RepID=UPI0029F46EB1|nr:tRNA (adenosine(37)-N6)-threonylcarbamoyltransferase complex ATPase subunit type 1 TsaE [uncultured Acetobacteroides sp.]